MNQKYFVCEDDKGELANAFICTANIEAEDGGARVVDKSAGNRQMYRLELWFKRKDQGMADELLGRMQTILGPTVKSCKWEFRPH